MTERFTRRSTRRRAIAAATAGLLAAGMTHATTHTPVHDPVRVESHAAYGASGHQTDHAETAQRRSLWRTVLSGTAATAAALAVLFPRRVARTILRGAQVLARSGGKGLAGVLALIGVGLIGLGLIQKTIGLFAAVGLALIGGAGWVFFTHKRKAKTAQPQTDIKHDAVAAMTDDVVLSLVRPNGT